MSRVAKWKIEKAKVKVVFRLQFHATNIPQHGWEKLFISFIPTETGKATAKTSKANVRGGSCKWADPIYETTRLLLDSKTKQYDDKLYKLVVGMGTSRSSILGEATINLADYADASQPAILSLPLHGSDHGTLLHVTVQLLTAKTGFREFEQQRDKGLQSGNNVNKETEHSTAKSPSSELQIPDDLVNKAKTRMQLREETIIHGEYSDSQVTCDESSNASDCYYADKHDSPAEKSSGSEQAKLDNDVAVVYEENNRLRASLAAAESSISELKQELTTLQSHANEMGTETQKLAQELTVEIASGQELVKEVNFLKSECSKFKNDLQNLKDVKSTSKVTERKLEVNGVVLVESQIREIQEKILMGESGLNNLQSDFEVLLRTVQDLKNETFGVVPIQTLQELETTKAENENLVKKMDQMECYYESLVHELEENQKRILADCQNLKTEINDLSSVNNELQKRVTVSESALKRARLNYSIAVSQLQKDLDMLSFQVLSMFETNQTVIKEAFADTTQPSSKHLSNDLKTSLSLQENIYKKVEEELSEMCSANLQLNVYSKTLEETLFEASDHIRKMNEKLQTLNQSRDSLVQENGYYLARCNDLDLQNRMLESDVGNLSNENFLLMEKITECEALLMDYRVFKGKYEVVSAEKMELQKLLEVEVSDKQNLQKEIKILTSEMDGAKMKFMNGLYQTVSKMEVQKPCFEKLQLQIDSVANMFQSSLESGERHVQNSEAMLNNLSSLELELQKISSDDKSFHEQIVSELKKENQELMVYVENKREELGRLQECLDAERGTVACLTSELESQRSELESFKLKLEASIAQNAEISKSNDALLETTLANVNNEHALEVRELKDMLTKSKAEVEQLKELQTKLEDTESRLNGCLKNEAFYIEENRNLATELESLRLELQASVAKNAEILESNAEHAFEASQLKEMLTNSKEELARYIDENRNFVTEIESLRSELQASVAKNAEVAESEKEHALKVGQLQEMLTKSKQEVARYIEENRNLVTEIESLRMEFQTSVSRNVEISESKTMHALEASQLKEMLTKSKDEVGRYIEENRNLATEVESLRLELQASVAEISESKTMHANEASQLKEMLTKSKEEVARYIEENRNLVTEIESLRSELHASVAKNAEVAESENEHALKVGQLKEMLTKSNEEVSRYIEENKNLVTEIESLRSELKASVAKNDEMAESKNGHALEVSQLKEMLTKSTEEVARYVEENRNLATEVESLGSELQSYVAKNAEFAESENEHALKVGQLKEMLTKSNEENEKLVTEIESLRSELQASVVKNAEIAESENEHAMKVGQLQEMLTKSNEEVARYVEENRNLAMKVESLGSELQSYVAEIAESENEHALKVGQLKDMLTKSNEEVTRYIEENRNLAMELESVRLELQASIAKNAEVSESNIELALTASQLKEMLTKSNEEVARYIEEKKSLATEVESRNVKLEDYIAHAAETKPTEVNYKNALDVDDVLTFQEETEITLLVFKAKLEERNEELITLQNQCDQLTNKLTEQKLKTEEFKNLSIYLKELKDSADVAHEKKEKDPEGPTESLRIAFIKEQYQTKIQELKQQLSVSKRHNEEMLFKLQDALDEVESRKRSEASQLRRIQELEVEGEVVVSDKPDYDRLQAELECAVLSLECCKEEKEKLAALLREREDEKSKLADELSLIREQIAQKEEKGSVNLQEIQGVTDRTLENEENPLANDSKQLMVVNDPFRTQHLMSCMEQLDEELEKMKNDNAHLSLTNFDPGFQDLQRELGQLHQANEELSSIYPNFVDFRGNGNALERVLALEIELAEALRTKKKSSIQFQSSFLKQHSDEEAVFKSFRDINELIKDMLEIKGKYVNVENELKEMHDRYSQLSLQFAEVEGERQKLMMTLKSVRSSRNLLRLNRSPVAALGDQS
ncbi:putative transcription factor bZIP family [Helianthus annuus]|uniref:Transcription factor bZIP family n=2 Tax=Helianthus annuus TaxID=4232 RepID=A0A9K3HKP7_HELAN|nr:intracellular protein transport protein USO1 [Helianthus annuus]KAF5779995.1 putative transcription factor bZIP family [Helianthus annuus]